MLKILRNLTGSTTRNGTRNTTDTATKKKSKGYSLLELLVCTSLLGILCMVLMPDLGDWKDRAAVERVTEDYIRLISFARIAAVTSGQMVTFCRSSNGKKCDGSWSEGTIIFSDSNRNRIIDGNDELLRYSPQIDKAVSVKFRSFRNRQYLQITPLGFTDYQNGNFTFCPQNMDNRAAQQIIINTLARTRRAQDTNGDGVRENSRGKPLSCP